MKKNVAGQDIGAQMVSATDGSAFTGAVTVTITGNGGTQGGGGACTHEGNGYHGYKPTQAETNYDHIAFTFTGTGAIPRTIQVYPAFPQTGDSFGLIGATGSGLTSLATQASVDAIDDFLDTEIAAIKAKTDNLPADPADASEIAASFASVNNDLAAIAGYIDTEVGAIKAKTDNLPSDPADASEIAASFVTVNSKLDAIDDFIDAEVAAIKAKTDNIPAEPAAVSDIPTAQTIAETVLNANLATGADTNERSLRNAARAAINKAAISGGILTVFKEDGTTTAFTRSVTTDADADPIVSINP